MGPVDLVPCMHSMGIATDPADTPDTAAVPARQTTLLTIRRRLSRAARRPASGVRSNSGAARRRAMPGRPYTRRQHETRYVTVPGLPASDETLHGDGHPTSCCLARLGSAAHAVA